MTDDLKPCPFCGGEAKLSLAVGEKKYRTVGCISEDCKMEHMFWLVNDSTEELAIVTWNTRPIEDRLHQKIDTIGGMYSAAEIECGNLKSKIDRLKIQVANRTRALEEYRHEIDHLTKERDAIVRRNVELARTVQQAVIDLQHYYAFANRLRLSHAIEKLMAITSINGGTK